MKRFASASLKALLISFALIPAWAQATPEMYFIHTDHLGTPQVMTDDTGSEVWRASYRPFGELASVEGSADLALRFPGQYEDPETGYYYNYFRDYDPSLGRYVQSDPIGLKGGLNTYGYTYQNPIRYTDPTGQAVPAIAGACAASPVCAAAVAAGAYAISQAAGDVARACGNAWSAWNESSEASDNGNTNPYSGPVDEPVIVVNGNGTGIPIGEGESIGSSPDGKWQEVKDKNGNRTGTRVDAGHPKTHDDPRARGPHGHRDGVSNSDGTPWLPW